MNMSERIVDETTGEVLDPKTSPDYYTLDAIRHSDIWTPENIRTEYNRLRKLALQRLKHMENDEIGRASKTFKMNIGKYKPANAYTPGELKIALHDVARMIGAKTGTLAGIKRQRKESIKTFQEHGYDFINESNYNEFGEFMRQWKSSMFVSAGSPIAVDFYEAYTESRKPKAESMARAHENVNKNIQKLFHEWETKRKREQNEGKRQNEKKVSAYALLHDWEEFLD